MLTESLSKGGTDVFSQDIFESAVDEGKRARYVDRWYSADGRGQYEAVMALVRKGGGEDFLQRALEYGDLSRTFFERDNDLKGIAMQGETIAFPSDDNFEGTDFSYASLSHCEFIDGYFMADFVAARLYGVTFRNCTFHYADFKNSTLTKCVFVGCDFIERCKFNNCKVEGTLFDDVYMNESIFESCKFDDGTLLVNLRTMPKKFGDNEAHQMPKAKLAPLYFDLAEAYAAGNSSRYSRHYFTANSFITRYNVQGWHRKLRRRIFNEYLMGYGERPSRCLLFSLAVILLFGMLFAMIGLQTSSGTSIGLFGSGHSQDLGSIATSLGETLFFSVVTFTTVGYGNIVPVAPLAKVLAATEMLIGVTLGGCWVALLLRKALRHAFSADAT